MQLWIRNHKTQIDWEYNDSGIRVEMSTGDAVDKLKVSYIHDAHSEVELVAEITIWSQFDTSWALFFCRQSHLY